MKISLTHRTAPLIFLLLFSAYTYFHQQVNVNANARLDVLHSFVLHGAASIDQYHENTIDKAFFQGHYFSSKAPGIAFLALPAFLASVGILQHVGIDIDSPRGWLISDWITTAGSVGILTALGGMYLFLFLRKYVSYRSAVLTTIGIFLGAAPFPYATMLFSHAAIIGLLMIALYYVLSDEKTGAWSHYAPRLRGRLSSDGMLWGLAITIAILSLWSVAKGIPSALLPLPAFIGLTIVILDFLWLSFQLSAYLERYFFPSYRRHPSWMCAVCGLASGFAIASEYTSALVSIAILLIALYRHGPISAWRVGAWMLLPLLLIPVYGFFAFGSPFVIGYSHEAFFDMNQGFFGIRFVVDFDAIRFLLFSPSRGLFFWSPVLLLLFAGMRACMKKFGHFITLLVLGIPLLQVILISSYPFYDGGWAIGPRHLASIIPFLAIVTAFGFERFPRLGIIGVFTSIVLTGFFGMINSIISPSSNPLFDYYLPLLREGHTASSNIAEAVGFSEMWSLFIPFIFIAVLCLFWYVFPRKRSIVQLQLMSFSFPYTSMSFYRQKLHLSASVFKAFCSTIFFVQPR